MKPHDVEIILYIAIIVVLVIAFVSVNIYKELAANKTTNETVQEIGFCNSPKDCDGLVHIECAGYWACEQNMCGYVCGYAAENTPSGLSGLTVECIEDNNCRVGTCPDGSEYKKYSCSNNKCIDIKYFADPCRYK
jgi:hypothetical protein